VGGEHENFKLFLGRKTMKLQRQTISRDNSPRVRVSRRWFRMRLLHTVFDAQLSRKVELPILALEPSDRFKVSMDEQTRLAYQADFLDFWILLKKCEREIPQAAECE
jgi:hypothetical protein